jgi:hypothetical protein
MPPSLRRLLAVGVCLSAAGCLGGTGNPSYFPHYLTPGPVVPTHAKPRGLGYDANFDPKAAKLEVTPTSRTVPTRTQQVLVATVRDKDGTPRRKRRVEWILDGPGSIIEVDESGLAAGRGYVLDNKRAVSYTDYFSHTITRGNDDPADDFELRPGQTWCVISSAVEGKTTVTVYAPEVYDWDAGRQFVTIDWQNAPFAARRGDEASRDREGAAAADVGPPLPGGRGSPKGDGVTLDVKLPAGVGVGREATAAVVLANGGRADSREVTVRSRVPDGTEYVRSDPPPTQRAGADLTWTLDRVPVGGTRAVTLVVRPSRKGAFTVAAAATTADGLTAKTSATAEADTAGLTVAVDATAFGAVGERLPVRVAVTNTGAVPVENAVAWVDVPAGVAVADARKNPAELTVGRVGPGETKTVTAALTPDKSGKFPVRVNVTADGGLAARGEATVTVSRTEITAGVTGPKSVGLGDDGLFDIVVSNPGDVPVRNLRVRASVPRGLAVRSAGDGGKVSADGAEWTVSTLPADGRATVRLAVSGERPFDRGAINVWASGDLPGGGTAPEARATAAVAVVGRSAVALELSTPGGPVAVGGRAVFRATVRNRGTAPATNVEAAIELSPEFVPVRGGAGRIADRKVIFPPTDLAAGASAVFTVEADATAAGPGRVRATASAADLPQPLREEQPVRVTGR